MAERAEAFATFQAYAGTYTVTGDRIVHHIEIASFENWVNTDQARTFRIEKDRLILLTVPGQLGGFQQTAELTWERIK